MTTPYQSPTAGHDQSERYDSISDADPVRGSHDTYAKGEIGSIGALISDISGDLATLMQQEVALAKAEVKDTVAKTGAGAGLLGGAGYAAHLMVLFASITLWMTLSYLFDDLAWSALVVAALWGVIAAVLAMVGRKQLKKVKGVPRTTETAKRIPDALTGNENSR